MKILNLFGGPGTGKSTTAAAVFYEMKKLGLEVELVTEYAKDVTWEERKNVLSDQIYIFAKQNRRLSRLKGKVDWVIADSPLCIGLIYMPSDYFSTFRPLVSEVWNSYDNHNFLLGRDFEYKPIGRNQTAEEAVEIDHAMLDLLDQLDAPFTRITNDPNFDRVSQILQSVGLNSGS